MVQTIFRVVINTLVDLGLIIFLENALQLLQIKLVYSILHPNSLMWGEIRSLSHFSTLCYFCMYFVYTAAIMMLYTICHQLTEWCIQMYMMSTVTLPPHLFCRHNAHYYSRISHKCISFIVSSRFACFWCVLHFVWWSLSSST